MLQKIREFSQGWLATVIVVAIGFSFVFWGVERYNNTGSNNSQALATVNGDEISANTFNITLQRYQEQQQNTPTAVDENLKQQVLQQLVRSLAMSQAALKNGYRISDAQIQQVLAAIPVFQVNGAFSKERFDQVLERMMYTESDFIRQLRQDMMINQQQLGVTATVFVLPNEINNAFQLIAQKRDFTYVLIPYKKYLDKNQISNESIQQYYEKNSDTFKNPEKVSISYLKLALPEVQSKIQISDPEAKQYYQDNIESYSKPQQWQIAHIYLKTDPQAADSNKSQLQKANDILAKIKSGKDFASLVSTFSNDVLTVNKQGILPWFSTGMMDKNIETAVAALKPGQVAGPIQTPNGIEIIKLIAIKPASITPFTQVKDQVKKQLATEKAQKQFADQAEQLGNLAYANPNSLAQASTTLGLKIQQTELFTRDGDKQSVLASNPKLVAAAFSKDVLNGDNSDVINLDQQTAVVIHLKQHQAPSIKPLAEVKNQIVEVLRKQKAEQSASQLAQQIAKKAEQGDNLTKLASSNHLKAEQLTNTFRAQKDSNQELIQKAFELPATSSKQKSASDVQLSSGDYAVIQLTRVEDGNLKDLKEAQQANLMKALENNLAQEEYQQLVNKIVSDAKVKIQKN